MRIRARVPELRLINARANPDLCLSLLAAGYDLDLGIVVHHRGAIYFGPAAAAYLSYLAKPAGRISSMLLRVSSASWFQHLFYPVFRFARWCLLKIRGRRMINRF